MSVSKKKRRKTTRKLKGVTAKSSNYLADFSSTFSMSMILKPLDFQAINRFNRVPPDFSTPYYRDDFRHDNLDSGYRASQIVMALTSRWRHYLDPDNLIDCSMDCDPEFLTAYLWGPLGEWTGIPVPKDWHSHVVKERFHAGGVHFNDRDQSIRCDYHSLSPWGERITDKDFFSTGWVPPSTLNMIRILRFTDYDSQIQVDPQAANGPREPHILALAGALQLLSPDPKRIWAWSGALKSGEYRLGHLCLRDLHDRYDPFGVLADTMGLPWKLDADEHLWGIDGDCFFLNRHHVQTGLGVTTARASHFAAFENAVVRVNDEHQCFEQLFHAAIMCVEARRTALKNLLLNSPIREHFRPAICMPENAGEILSLTCNPIDPVDPTKWREEKYTRLHDQIRRPLLKSGYP